LVAGVGVQEVDDDDDAPLGIEAGGGEGRACCPAIEQFLQNAGRDVCHGIWLQNCCSWG